MTTAETSELKALRTAAMRKLRFDSWPNRYRSKVKTVWAKMWGNTYADFIVEFNRHKTHRFKFDTYMPGMGGIKLFFILKEMDYDPQHTMMFVGEAPFYGFMLSLMEWGNLFTKSKSVPEVKIRVSSPEGMGMLMTNLILLKNQLKDHWFAHDTNNIMDATFQYKLMQEWELCEWFVSDIGTGGNNNDVQHHNQSEIISCIHNIITNSDVGSKGLIIKTYKLHDAAEQKWLAEMARLYDTYNIIKPPGSPITNDEVYFIATKKIVLNLDPTVPAKNIDIIAGSNTEGRVRNNDIYRKWRVHLNNTINYYRDSIHKLQNLPFNSGAYELTLARHIK